MCLYFCVYAVHLGKGYYRPCICVYGENYGISIEKIGTGFGDWCSVLEVPGTKNNIFLGIGFIALICISLGLSALISLSSIQITIKVYGVKLKAKVKSDLINYDLIWGVTASFFDIFSLHAIFFKAMNIGLCNDCN